jgi:hypothetical protein
LAEKGTAKTVGSRQEPCSVKNPQKKEVQKMDKKKKQLLVIIALCVIVGIAVFALAANKPSGEPSDAQINELKKVILLKNGISEEGAKTLQVDRMIEIPSFKGRPQLFYRLKEKDFKGRHDCIWNAAKHWLRGDLVDSSITEEQAPTLPANKPNNDDLDLYLLILSAFFLVGVYLFIKHKLDQDPSRHKPFIDSGICVDDPEIAFEQLDRARSIILPMDTRSIVGIQSGYLKSIDGDQAVLIPMFFADGKMRKVRVRSTDDIWKVYLDDGTYEYYHGSGGNLMGEVFDGEFCLPDGWYFVPTAPMYSPPEPEKTNTATSQAKKETEERGYKVTVTSKKNTEGDVTVTSEGPSELKPTLITIEKGNEKSKIFFPRKDGEDLY